MLDVDNLKFSYDDANAFSFTLKADLGEIVVVEGPSGVGKSTLLNMIAGFLPPQSGRLTWNGADMLSIPPSDRPLSMIFQDSNLFDHLTCRDNIAIGLSPRLKLDAAAWQRVDDAMDVLGISSLAHRSPNLTSGGQQQRVALARALVRASGQDRRLMLFDEPFSALDPETRQDAIEAVLAVMARGDFTALVVSHDANDAKALGARVVKL